MAILVEIAFTVTACLAVFAINSTLWVRFVNVIAFARDLLANKSLEVMVLVENDCEITFNTPKVLVDIALKLIDWVNSLVVENILVTIKLVVND